MIQIKEPIKFLFLGIAAWAYSIVVQTPFAYFVWHFTFNQWITWTLSGLLITTIFFGAPLRIFLNWCNSHFDRVFDLQTKPDIQIMNVKELTYDDAAKLIDEYLKCHVQPVPIVVLAEKLQIDIDLIIQYMHDKKEND